MDFSNSERLFGRGRKFIPDGVSSPMRAFPLVEGAPICVASAKGSKVTDVDGNVYTDFLNAFGALILGHARREVVEAIQSQVLQGSIWGLSHELEYQVAETIVSSTPEIDQIRFVCSGTEAVMTATRIARAHTGRRRLVKFNGSYHGHADALLAIPADVATKSKGVTQGIPAGLGDDVILCQYNDTQQLADVFARYGDEIAAVIVEPFATNMGFVKPQGEFLAAIRNLCSSHGALFIFDEVVTGFRFRFGAVCSDLGIDPDLVTFGKIIGGGTPIGAFAGKRQYMQQVEIGQSVFQSGTFASNPLTMAASFAALGVLSQPGFYDRMEQRSQHLEAEITKAFTEFEVPYLFTRHGALAGIAFRDDARPLTNYQDVKTQEYDVFRQVHRLMLERGFLLPPSLEEPLFLSDAHTNEDLHAFARALAESVHHARARVLKAEPDAVQA